MTFADIRGTQLSNIWLFANFQLFCLCSEVCGIQPTKDEWFWRGTKTQQAWRDPNTKKITQRFWKRHFFYLYEHIHPPIFLNRALGGFWEKCISLFGADFQPIFTQPLPSGLLWGGFINFLVIGHHRGWPRINFIFCSFSFFAIFGPFFQFWALFSFWGVFAFLAG